MNKVRRAEIAKNTLDHGFIQDAIKDIKEHCHKNIETSSHDQKEEREDMYYLLRSVSCFEKILFKYIQEGKAALGGLKETSIKQLQR